MPPILDQSVLSRATTAECECYVDWISALRMVDGNPWNAEVREFVDATIVLVPGCHARIVNRCFGLSQESAAYLPAILDCFDRHGIAPCFDINPFGSHGRMDLFLRNLSAQGLGHFGFHQGLVGFPGHGEQDRPESRGGEVSIEAAGEEAVAEYRQIYEPVFGDARLITVLLSHPAFHCFLARVNGRPAALGVLHVKGTVASMANGITSPEFRGRGLQLALLRHRMEAARNLGCDLVVSQAETGVTSLRNQLRAGLSLGATKALWGRVAVGG